jgi:hypothetical protein
MLYLNCKKIIHYFYLIHILLCHCFLNFQFKLILIYIMETINFIFAIFSTHQTIFLFLPKNTKNLQVN